MSGNPVREHIATYQSQLAEGINASLAEHVHILLNSNTEREREFLTPATALLQGGKRTRAIMLVAGAEVAHSEAPQEHYDWPIKAGVAIELYQASALIHDDLIDGAETRRGILATHRQFEATHAHAGLHGEASAFGEKAALLLGDFLLSLASITMQSAEHRDSPALNRAMRIFHEMTFEVAYGQYLDMRAEFTPLGDPYDDYERDVRAAFEVLTHKSARYSVELPARIGAELYGASRSTIEMMANVTRPLGEAFQLRDDDLGVFGDARTTGKPVGGDISEGKRTVLLALTRKLATASDRAYVDQSLGHPISSTDLERIQSIIEDSGARAEHNAIIAQRERAARDALAKLETTLGTRCEVLDETIEMLTNRKS
ncbi:MAG: polyprenyl synthetase family protein [Actinomycetaceae bacterium]|nr:polyprenyl synthetase family protein [Arcanobacterium sp.]MDD7504697.1 polyprenyl synthetase family protein [Actinomycetaceae bacterium]MDY6142967.1 polyprenyl synthetase family protein [Arcanobacterium sp.]